MEKYTLGLDIGSSSVKAALVSVETGLPVALAQYPDQEMDIAAPQPGWAEQDPHEWWSCVVQATRRLLEQVPQAATQTAAVGIAYQMHGLVCVDEAGEVLRPAIIWCDSRAVAIGEKAWASLGSDVCLSHLLNSPGNFTASKLRWVQEHEPEIYNRIHKILLPGDYIAMRMTKAMRTTITGLSEGVFWDYQSGDVSEDVLGVYQISPSLIPDRVSVFGNQGELSPEAAAELGLLPGTPVSYRAGDQPNNALSLNVLEPGQVAATGGTSGVVYAVSGEPVFDAESRVNGFAHVNYHFADPRIGILLCINGTGIQYNWVRKLMGSSHSYTELEALAANIPAGAEGLVMLPFGNGVERMLGNTPLGAHMHGIDFNRHTQAHVVRAALEGIAFAFAYGMRMMQQMGLDISHIRVGNDNLFQSAVFSNTLSTLTGAQIDMVETNGATGAARAAGYGARLFPDLAGVLSKSPIAGTYSPDTDPQQTEQIELAYSAWEQVLQKRISNN